MWKALKGLPKGRWRQTLCPLTSSTKPEKTLSCHNDDFCEKQKDIDANFEKDVSVSYSSCLSRPESVTEIADRRRSHLTWWKRVSSHNNFGTGNQFSNNFYEFLGFGFVIVAGLKYCRNGYFCNDDQKKKSDGSDSWLKWDALFRTQTLQRFGLQRTVLPLGSTILSESVSSDSDSFDNDNDEIFLEESEESSTSSSSSFPLLQEHLIRLRDITNQYVAYKLNEDALELVREEKFSEAVERFHDASELGFNKAIFNLGVCYEIGQGIEQDLTKAWSCYERAAKLGHTNASYNLAVFYLEGKGVSVNESEGLKWMEKASESGIKEAQTFMGVYYGQNEDYGKAVNLFKKAVEQKHSDAEYWLGLCYEHGLGVEANLTEATQLFLKSAEAGNVDACYNLAMYYERGLGGLAKDKNHALELYYRAATSGHPLAVKKLEFGLENAEDETVSNVSSPKSKPSSKQEGIRAVSSLPDITSVTQNTEKKVATSSSLLDLTAVKKLLINYFEYDLTNKRKKYYIDEEEPSNLLLNDRTFENSKTILG